MQARQTARLKTFVDLFRSSSTDRRLLIENYHELIGLDKERAERFIEHVNVEETPLDDVRAMVIAHYDLRLPRIYTFLASALAESLGLDEVRVSAILDQYALAWGALSEYETERFHLSNPVWEKPLVKTGRRRVLRCLARGLFQFRDPVHGSRLVSVCGRG